ncbi:hypothetical protein [Inquilinus sp. Marseille-Q2685]|uniref:hypothetical protein n=1 Tax=Inquilinus sp. Marseille-Q2685 TaxID=2866581 RepID=UPI001CE4341D|nr:hypothetical protein [Inquilinus sp. Marseille-Q2685]
MTTDPDLTSKLEGFAYKSAEERRRAFMEMLRQVEKETNCEGAVTLDEALAEIDGIIAEAEQCSPG